MHRQGPVLPYKRAMRKGYKKLSVKTSFLTFPSTKQSKHNGRADMQAVLFTLFLAKVIRKNTGFEYAGTLITILEIAVYTMHTRMPYIPGQLNRAPSHKCSPMLGTRCLQCAQETLNAIGHDIPRSHRKKCYRT